MKDDIRKKTCLIVRRNGEYLVGRFLGSGDLRWSTSPYDAWWTRKPAEAQTMARRTGGTVMLFNPISKEMRVY